MKIIGEKKTDQNIGKTSRKNIRVWVTTLSAVMVFLVTYALILPAITLEQKKAEDLPGIYLEKPGEGNSEEGRTANSIEEDTEVKDETTGQEEKTTSLNDAEQDESSENQEESSTVQTEEKDTFVSARSPLSVQTKNYEIFVAFDEKSGIPEGTRLSVETLKTDSAEYHDYYAALKKSMEEDTKISRGPVFNLSLTKRDETIIPKGKVSLLIRPKDNKILDSSKELRGVTWKKEHGSLKAQISKKTLEEDDSLLFFEDSWELIKGQTNVLISDYDFAVMEPVVGLVSLPGKEKNTTRKNQKETVAVEDLRPAQNFEGKAGKIHVNVSAPKGAFPAGTTMKVKMVKDKDAVNAVTEAVEKDSTGNAKTQKNQSEDGKAKVKDIQAVDITFTNADGDEIEPEIPIQVTMTSGLVKEAAAKDDLQITAVHLPDKGQGELVDCNLAGQSGGKGLEKDEISFEAESFSIYALVTYTVDFEYSVNGKMYQFSLPGGEKITLSDLVEVLGIIGDTNSGEKAAFNSVEDFLKEVANVQFSDESLVKVTPVEGDWELESLQPFSTDEDLTITMKNGDVVTVKVTDAQYTDITSLLSSVTISGATQNSDGSYNVFPGTPYTIALKFDETPQDTFNRNGSVTYKLPNGVKIPEATSGTLVPSDSTQAEIYSINYTIAADGTITFSWDIKPGKEQEFLVLPGMFIGLNIEAEFDENATTIDWHGAAQVTVDKTHDVGVNKTANLGQDGYMYYTVTVTSTGDNKNISLTDTISGTALTLDQSSITETTNHGATFSNKTNKGFDISIPELKHGESATITYRAEVDYDVLASEAGVEKGQYGTVTTTGNQIRINGTDDNPDNNTSETHADHNISFSSTGKGVTEGHYNEETGKRTMNWQIKANDEHRTTISYIHDEMGEGSDKMNYSGEGITVKVVNPDWSVAATYTVPWSQLGVNASSTEWTYNIPDQYKDKNYSFVIDYTTDVDVSDSIVPVAVKNDADTDYGEGGTGGKADPAPGSKLDMEKSVVETDIPGGTVTWSITVDVPATGLDSCVVTDTLPSVTGPESFTDGFDSSSFSAARDVAGLIDGETVSLDTTQSGKVIFTFYKDGQPGLYPVEGGRKVTITLTTTLDEDWMAYEITQDYLRYYNTHTNNAKVVANNYTVEDSASVTVNGTDPSMIKKNEGSYKDNFYQGGDKIDAWMYRLYLYGISDDTFSDGYLEITDTFDERYLDYYDPDNSNITAYHGEVNRLHQTLTYGDETGQVLGPEKINVSVSNGTITFRVPQSLFKSQDGTYHRYYHINYFLHAKDQETMHKMDEDALAAGGTLKIKNTAVWAYSEPTEVEVEHKIPIIEKDYTVKDADAGVYDFVIKVNEGGNQLGDADYLEVTDSYTNLTIDYATLTCEPEDALLSYTHSGNTVTYFVKTGVPVTLRYTASALESGAFSNTVEVNNQSVTKTGTANITSRGSTGAREASIKILKHAGSNLLEGIAGVQFELYEYDESYPNNYNPAAKVLSGTYSTDANGMFTIRHIPLAVEDGSYTTHTKKYVLHEVEPPEGYKALPHDYVFTVDTQTASYGQYIYLHDDTLPISNEPIKDEDISITVNKIWPDGDADLPELIRVRLYQKDSRTASAASAIEVDVAEMTRGADGSWTHTFAGLDPEKAYFIKEDPVEGYTASYSSNNILGLEQSGTINITNTKDEPDDETTSITVKKKWMQGEEEITDIEQKKDLSATVELVRYRAEQTGTTVHFINAGSTEDIGTILLPRNKNNVTFTADVTGSGTWAYLTSYTAGKRGHEYVNDNSDSIHASGHINGGNGISVTINTPDVSDIYIVFCYGTITSITATTEESIGGSGEGTIDPTYTAPETITLDRVNGWRASFSNLPTSGTGSDDGKAYSYTYGIRETATSDSSFAFESYSVETYDGEGSNNATVAVASGGTVTVTNKKEAPQTGSLKLTKVVQVDDDTLSTGAEKNLVNGDYVFTVSSGNSIVKYVQITVTNGAPASYKIANTQEGLASVDSVEGTSALVSGLDEGDYVITEIEKNGMTLKEAARGDNDTDAVSEDNAVTVHVTAGENEPADSSAAAATFTNNIETVTAKVVKVWDHTGNTGTHPGSLNVTLSNGETYELNEGNNWTAEVTDLPKYDRTTGSLIEYSWTEAELPAGYYLSNIQESADETTGVITTTLTNSYTDSYNPTTTISGKKVWDDGGVNRPESITVNLYKDGDTTTPYRTSTVQAPTGEGADQDQWPFEFTNLPVFNSDGSVIQYTVGEVLPAGYTEEYGIKIEFTQATYIAGDTTGVIVNSGQGDQTFKITDGYNLGYIVIRHGNDFIIWTPRPATADEISAIKTKVVGLSDQFNGINSASGDSMKIVSGVPGTVDVGKKHAVSVYMQNGEVWMQFLNPNAWSDFAYGTIPYTYTQAGGEGGGTITNTKKNTELEFGKKWIDIGQQEIDWDRDIQVTVSRNRGDGKKDTTFSLVYNIARTSVDGATGGTAEFSTGTETDPKLKLTITTESGTKKYSFKIENLAYSSETDGKYTYYVEETNSQMTGYLAPSYTNTSAPTGAAAAYDGGTIINKQEGGYELPSTGGPGTNLVYLFGIIFTGFAGVGLMIRKRRKAA